MGMANVTAARRQSAMKHGLVLVAIVISILGSRALQADTVPCYGLTEIEHSCNPEEYYCSEYVIDYCYVGGCMGPTCSTGYGYCCGRQYATQIISGEADCQGCEEGDQLFRRDLDIDRYFHKKDAPFPDHAELVPKPAYYVPSKCDHLYGVVDPPEFYKSSEGI